MIVLKAKFVNFAYGVCSGVYGLVVSTLLMYRCCYLSWICIAVVMDSHVVVKLCKANEVKIPLLICLL